MMLYDPSAPVGKVRLRIGDTTNHEPDRVFSDDEIQSLLDSEGGPLSAAAACLEIIADSEARLSKAIRTQDLATDGPKVADSLRKHAASLRAQARAAGEGEEEGGFAIAPYQSRPTAPELANFRTRPW